MVETTRSLDDIDALLRRNWFLDREDVLDLLYLATEEDWQWIVQNRTKYDSYIQDIICTEARLPKIKTKLYVRDLSDREYDEIMFEREKQYGILVEKKWQEYKALHDVHPPPSHYTTHFELLNANYEKEVKEYNRYGTDKNAILSRIQTLKNEIEQLQEKIVQYNKDWEFLAKSEFRINGTVSKLLQEESHCTNV